MNKPADIDENEQAFRIYQSADDFALRRPIPAVATPSTVAQPSLSSVPLGIAEHRSLSKTEPAADLNVRRGPTLVTIADVSIPAEIETQLTQILASSPVLGETLELAYKRKEHEIGSVFARLSALESRTLHERLTLARQDDALATQFSRLIETRRLRLLAFLNDARRREALSQSRR